MKPFLRQLKIMDMIIQYKQMLPNIIRKYLCRILLVIFFFLVINSHPICSPAGNNINTELEVMNKVQEIISPIKEYLEIKSVEYNNIDGTWHIEGYSDTMDTIFRYFIPSLELSDYFRNVKPIKAYSKIETDKAYFLISVELREPFEIIPSGSGKIRGRVMEIATGKPIVNVKVRFMIDGNKYTQCAITDDKGVFVILIEPGKYFIVGEEVKPISYKDTISGSTKAFLSSPGTKREVIVEKDKAFDIEVPIFI